MTLEQLRAARNALVAKLEVLAALDTAGTDLTEDQATEFVDVSAEFEKLDAKVKRLETVEQTRARLKEPRPSAGALQVVDEGAVLIDAVAIPGGPDAQKHFQCFEEFLSAVTDARTGEGVDQRLRFKELDLRGEQSMGTGTKGGFMVPEEFRTEILAVDEAQTPIIAAAMHLPPGTAPDAAVSFPALNQDTNQQGGVTVARIGEGVAKPETDFDLKQVTWTPTEIAGHIALSDQLIRNWSGAMGMAQTLLRSAINAALESEAYNGNGVAQMTGILQSPATIKVARTGALGFVLADVANMAKRKLQRGSGGFWLYNQLLLSELMQMKDGNNNLVWQNNVRDGSPGTLWGMPARPYEFAAAVGSLGDVMLVQPNPYYVIKDGSGPFVDVGWTGSDFTNNKRRVKIFLLNDGGPWLQAPFKLKNGTEVSPFVALDVP